MRIGFYTGSFNPWHLGHQDVLDKALKLFDKIIIYQLTNPEKSEAVKPIELPNMQSGIEIHQKPNTFQFIVIGNYVLDHVHENNQYAIIRGLRNAADLDYEKVQQSYNKKLGMKIPTVYFIADEEFVNISSTAERTIEKFQALEEKRREEERRSYEENS